MLINTNIARTKEDTLKARMDKWRHDSEMKVNVSEEKRAICFKHERRRLLRTGEDLKNIFTWRYNWKWNQSLCQNANEH